MKTKKKIYPLVSALFLFMGLFLSPIVPLAKASTESIVSVCTAFGGITPSPNAPACSIALCFSENSDGITDRATCLSANPARGIEGASPGLCYMLTGAGGSFASQNPTDCSTITEKYISDADAREQLDEETGPETDPVEGTADDNTAIDCDDPDLDESNCQIVYWLNRAFDVASSIIVLAVIGNIVYAGIRYSTSQGDPSTTGAAKKRIRDAVMALLMFMLLYSFLQWLIPGGVF